jgi:hypothetical membrane protein
MKDVDMSETTVGFDRSAAVTRSFLGWGVVAGPFYVIVGLVLALTRPGFDLTRHALSLLSLGEFGWMQRTNFILSGLMVIAAAVGILRAVKNGRGLAMGVLVAVFGACLVLSGIFAPDPVDGFPPGSTASASVSGILHLLFGGIGFLALAVAAFAYAGWCRSERIAGQAVWAIVLGILVIAGFVGGAALSKAPIGVLLLWIAVLAGWAWLALACARIYRWTPHPVTGARA